MVKKFGDKELLDPFFFTRKIWTQLPLRACALQMVCSTIKALIKKQRRLRRNRELNSQITTQWMSGN